MANVKQIVGEFIGAAQKNPGDRPEIFRTAAYTMMGLAQNPKNARAAAKLAQIGTEFANAAHAARPPVMDDFVDLLRETQQAYHEVGDDPMDLVARRREIHEDRTRVPPGQVFITPESFNRDATLGRSAKIKFNPTPDEVHDGILQSVNVAFWQGTKKEAQAMTVDVSLGFLPTLNNIPDVPTPINARPYGEVEFGSDGNRTKVKFDVAEGKRFTVVGNYIAVTVGMDQPRAGSGSPVITAGASVGAFAAPSPAPLILTEYADAIAIAGDSRVIPVPLRAVQLLPMQTTLFPLELMELTWYDFGGNIVGRTFYQQARNYAPAPIPIMGDWAFVQVHNSSIVRPTDIRLPFQLAM